jgi:hypothetical protein
MFEMRNVWPAGTPVLILHRLARQEAGTAYAARLIDSFHAGQDLRIKSGPMAPPVWLGLRGRQEVLLTHPGAILGIEIDAYRMLLCGKGGEVEQEYLVVRDIDGIVERLERDPPVWPQYLRLAEEISRAVLKAWDCHVLNAQNIDR